MMKIYFKFNQNTVELGINMEVMLLFIVTFLIILEFYPEQVELFVQFVHGLTSMISAN